MKKIKKAKDPMKYKFTIELQLQRNSSQEKLTKDIIELLKVTNIEFEMVRDEKDKDFLRIQKTVFKFKTMDEAVKFAIKVLETGHVFMCSLEKNK